MAPILCMLCLSEMLRRAYLARIHGAVGHVPGAHFGFAPAAVRVVVDVATRPGSAQRQRIRLVDGEDAAWREQKNMTPSALGHATRIQKGWPRWPMRDAVPQPQVPVRNKQGKKWRTARHM